MEGLLAKTALLIILTLLPGLELRLSIPVGISEGSARLPLLGEVAGLGLPAWYVFLVAFFTNTLLAAALYALLDTIVTKLLLPRWRWFARHYEREVRRAQRRVHDRVERWGWLGLALFIAVPLPGSGAYTGSLAAYGLGMSFRTFLLAATAGLLAAGLLVTLATIGATSLFQALF